MRAIGVELFLVCKIFTIIIALLKREGRENEGEKVKSKKEEMHRIRKRKEERREKGRKREGGWGVGRKENGQKEEEKKRKISDGILPQDRYKCRALIRER